MRVGSAEVGGLIETVEFGPERDLAWTSVTGIDQRGRWRLREAARTARGSSCACSTAWPAAGSGRGWPSSWPARSCGERQADARAAQAGGRARAGAGRGGPQEGGTDMRKLLRGSSIGAALPRRRRPQAKLPPTRDILTVGNNWDGTADLVDPRRFKRPQAAEHHSRPATSGWPRSSRPGRLGYFLAIRQLVGEGHDQFVDDMFTSHDGRLARTSRGRASPTWSRSTSTPARSSGARRSRATAPTTWRSRPTARGCRLGLDRGKVHVLDTRTGRDRRRASPPATQPHENNYSARRQADLPRQHRHSSTRPPTTRCWTPRRATAGSRSSTRKTLQILKRIDMGKKLAEAGYPDMSSAVRPMALAPGRAVRLLPGLVLPRLRRVRPREDRVPRLAQPAVSARPATAPRAVPARLRPPRHRDEPAAATKLCVAGTMSDYAAIVRARDVRVQARSTAATKPYWSTNSGDGRYCFVSVCGDDKRLGRSPTGPARRSRGSRSATIRSGCGWARSAAPTCAERGTAEVKAEVAGEGR